MMNNQFESALAANDFEAFFRGIGKYFVQDPDNRGHVHGAKMGGAARTFADQSESNARIFDEAFLTFVKRLSVTKEDLSHLLANLSSYSAQKSRGGFKHSNFFDNKDSAGIALVKLYLEEIKNSPFGNEVKEKIIKHANFIDRKGSNMLIEIISDIWSGAEELNL
jgi:hypothetical protein